jgi:NADPH-dependent F420 reductase
MARIALLGGTGAEGLGLALRFGIAGEDIIIGSRQQQRAEQAAQRLRTMLRDAGAPCRVDAGDNAAAVAAADTVALSLPYEGVEPTLAQLGSALAGKLVLDVVNPLVFDRGMFRILPIAAGSAGELIQQLLPRSPVVCAFKNLSAKQLLDAPQQLRGDVLLCGDHADAKRYVVDLIRRIPVLRAVDAGAIGNAQHLESITALLMNLNRRYKTSTSVEVLSLEQLDSKS